ncbi:hypothetical protein L6R46_11500 [Myxococcota bacterium]|nr:hypothetical protein [Myxococcota bacterium]
MSRLTPIPLGLLLGCGATPNLDTIPASTLVMGDDQRLYVIPGHLPLEIPWSAFDPVGASVGITLDGGDLRGHRTNTGEWDREYMALAMAVVPDHLALMQLGEERFRRASNEAALASGMTRSTVSYRGLRGRRLAKKLDFGDYGGTAHVTFWCVPQDGGVWVLAEMSHKPSAPPEASPVDELLDALSAPQPGRSAR